MFVKVKNFMINAKMLLKKQKHAISTVMNVNVPNIKRLIPAIIWARKGFDGDFAVW